MKAASPVVVDLYRLAFNAGRPVTFDELVDGMPSAYQNDANRWYMAKLEAEGKPLPASDQWEPAQLRSVKADWVAEQLTGMLTHKLFSCKLTNGQSPRGKKAPRTDLLYSVVKEKDSRGRGGPPMVEEQIIKTHSVPWTPEIGAIGRRHVAGIKFRDEMARITALGAKASKHDLEVALELALEALSYGPEVKP